MSSSARPAETRLSGSFTKRLWRTVVSCPEHLAGEKRGVSVHKIAVQSSRLGHSLALLLLETWGEMRWKGAHRQTESGPPSITIDDILYDRRLVRVRKGQPTMRQKVERDAHGPYVSLATTVSLRETSRCAQTSSICESGHPRRRARTHAPFSPSSILVAKRRSTQAPWTSSRHQPQTCGRSSIRGITIVIIICRHG